MKLRHILLYIALILSEAAFANDTLESIKQQLVVKPPLQSEFVQYKTLSILPQPLVSEGMLYVSKSQQLTWRTHSPIASTLYIDGNGLKQTVDGEASTTIDSQSPGIATVINVIRAVMSTDWPTLARYFELEARLQEPHWEIDLHPKDPQLQAAIQRIEMQGSDHVDTIVLFEVNGDSTRITFQNTQPLADVNAG